jgi:hypothetical protein
MFRAWFILVVWCGANVDYKLDSISLLACCKTTRADTKMLVFQSKMAIFPCKLAYGISMVQLDMICMHSVIYTAHVEQCMYMLYVCFHACHDTASLNRQIC